MCTRGGLLHAAQRAALARSHASCELTSRLSQCCSTQALVGLKHARTRMRSMGTVQRAHLLACMGMPPALGRPSPAPSTSTSLG